jgi:hypothetical protein
VGPSENDPKAARTIARDLVRTAELRGILERMEYLRKRFEAFIKTVRGFESIDDLLNDKPLEGRKRADYLLWDRTIIVEQKVLEADPSYRPQKFVNDLMKKRGILFYGTLSTDHIFARLPDGQEQKRRMLLSITKGLEASIADADKQTRDTREIFSIPDAIGIVVILNVSAPTLRPDLISYSLNQVFEKRRNDDSVRYQNNDGVIVISEAHTDISQTGRGAPCFANWTPHTKSEATVRAFADDLIYAWSAFNGLPVKRQDTFRF